MQITLKKVLFVGIGILSALFFFLVIVLPVSRTISITVLGQTTTTTISGSLMGVLTGDSDSIAMVKSQVHLEDFLKSIESTNPEALAQATKAFQDAQEALVSVYKVFAVLGIILFACSLLALIGGFFMKTIKATRKLGIPFLAIDIVLSLVVMIFAIVMTASTDMVLPGATASVSTAGPVLMYLLGILFFIGALVASGVVKEKVLVGKKN